MRLMLKSVVRDRYTFTIVALVPFILLTAWGLYAWDERQLHERQCEVAVTWLEESKALLPLYERSRTMKSIDHWIAGIEEIDSPSHANQLRHGILSSAKYQNTYFPNQSTSVPGVLNPQDGMFARDINEGAATVLEHCPETESLMPTAFPMVFNREESN